MLRLRLKGFEAYKHIIFLLTAMKWRVFVGQKTCKLTVSCVVNVSVNYCCRASKWPERRWFPRSRELKWGGGGSQCADCCWVNKPLASPGWLVFITHWPNRCLELWPWERQAGGLFMLQHCPAWLQPPHRCPRRPGAFCLVQSQARCRHSAGLTVSPQMWQQWSF